MPTIFPRYANSDALAHILGIPPTAIRETK